MPRRRKKKRELRTLAAPFTIAAPTGARIRDRLCVTTEQAEVLWLVGEHLGHHQRADLAERVSVGRVKAKDNQRAARKKNLTAVSSSRWAGAMTRASQDQYQLRMRVLFDERACLRRAIRTISRRLAAPCGKHAGTTRGYANQAERYEKQRRLQILTARLAVVQARIESGRPSIVVGGRRLAKLRHNLEKAELTVEEWRLRWVAKRLFLTADGESGAPFGNYTISVHPEKGQVSIVLPEPLRQLANAPGAGTTWPAPWPSRTAVRNGWTGRWPTGPSATTSCTTPSVTAGTWMPRGPAILSCCRRQRRSRHPANACSVST
ncbi:hypothetical protein [Streptomyces sp. CA-106131]|uniref:hypothetical protein n=1 Tax=Streptomyces sp. CA-106131 TaxID=3240045 RepID=UPI003D921F46